MSVAASVEKYEPPVLQPEGQVVLINRLTVASEDVPCFLAVWADEEEYMRRQPGFVSAQLHRARRDDGPYVRVVVWDSAQALEAALHSPQAQELAGRYPVSAARGQELVSASGPSYRFGSVEIDALAREVRKDGEEVRLTRKEYELLLLLVSHPRRTFARDELMDRVWQYRAVLETGTLTVHVRRLREKLEDEPAKPRYLQTVWGIGYRFVP
jgi:DNA-binding response OmpR family regulator